MHTSTSVPGPFGQGRVGGNHNLNWSALHGNSAQPEDMAKHGRYNSSARQIKNAQLSTAGACMPPFYTSHGIIKSSLFIRDIFSSLKRFTDRSQLIGMHQWSGGQFRSSQMPLKCISNIPVTTYRGTICYISMHCPWCTRNKGVISDPKHSTPG